MPSSKRRKPKPPRWPTERQRQQAASWIQRGEETARRPFNYGERVAHLARAFDWSIGTIERIALEGLEDGRRAQTAESPAKL